MRTRVLYTNGVSVRELFWISHRGSDVYCGPTDESLKFSYHASGKVHTKSDGIETHGSRHVPLAELRGHFPLTSLGFFNTDTWFEARGKHPEYRRGKAETLLMIDSR